VVLKPKAFLIKAGTILRDQTGEVILDARSSVTLMVSGEEKILVDSGLRGEETSILSALSKLGLEPEDISMVINTHHHPDHNGNNHLFRNAELLSMENSKMGEDVAPGICIMETPGHTLDSISAVCSSDAVVVACGDALPTFNNFLKLVPPRVNVDRELALASMSRIIDIANIVIPGHDRPFSVKDRDYTTLPP
jgi:N-acyl homoserine lactone hydrolase